MNVRPFYLWPWLPEDRGQDPGLRQCRSSECGVGLGVDLGIDLGVSLGVGLGVGLRVDPEIDR